MEESIPKCQRKDSGQEYLVVPGHLQLEERRYRYEEAGNVGDHVDDGDGQPEGHEVHALARRVRVPELADGDAYEDQAKRHDDGPDCEDRHDGKIKSVKASVLENPAVLQDDGYFDEIHRNAVNHRRGQKGLETMSVKPCSRRREPHLLSCTKYSFRMRRRLDVSPCRNSILYCD